LQPPEEEKEDRDLAEKEERNDIRPLKPRTKLGCAAVLMLVVILCVVLGVLVGQGNDNNELEKYYKPSNEPTSQRQTSRQLMSRRLAASD
jgi:hypothetical protein